MTLREAAAELGISKEALKARVRRAGITLDKTPDGQGIVTSDILELLKRPTRDGTQNGTGNEAQGVRDTDPPSEPTFSDLQAAIAATDREAAALRETIAQQDRELMELRARCDLMETQKAAAEALAEELRAQIADLRADKDNLNEALRREQTIAAGAQKMALLERNPSGGDMPHGEITPEDGAQKWNESATKAQQKKPFFWQRKSRK